MTAGRDNPARLEPSSRLWGPTAPGSREETERASRQPCDGPPNLPPSRGMNVRRPVVVTAPAVMTGWQAVRDFQHRCESPLHGEANGLILDLTQVQAVDTKLVACLVTVQRRARARAVSLEIRPSAAVRDLADLCRLGTFLGRHTPG